MIVIPLKFKITDVVAARKRFKKFAATCLKWQLKRYCLPRNGWFWNSCREEGSRERNCDGCECAQRALTDIRARIVTAARMLTRREVLALEGGSSYDRAVTKAKEAARIAAYYTNQRNPIMVFVYWAKALAKAARAPLSEP